MSHIPDLSNLKITPVGAPVTRNVSRMRLEKANDIPFDLWEAIIAAAAGHDCETVLALCGLDKTLSETCRSENPDFWNPIFEASQFIKNQPKLSDIWKWGMSSNEFYKHVCRLQKADNQKELVRLFFIDESSSFLNLTHNFTYSDQDRLQTFVLNVQDDQEELPDDVEDSDVSDEESDLPKPTPMSLTGTIEMPPGLKEVRVWAFGETTNITEVNFTGCHFLTDISDYCFRNIQLKKLTLAACAALKKIGKSAFFEAQLKTLDLTGCTSLKVIDDNAFKKSPLKTLILDERTVLDHVGNNAFWNTSLANLPERVRILGSRTRRLAGLGL